MYANTVVFNRLQTQGPLNVQTVSQVEKDLDRIVHRVIHVELIIIEKTAIVFNATQAMERRQLILSLVPVFVQMNLNCTTLTLMNATVPLIMQKTHT